MTEFKTHTIETAPEAAKPLLQGAVKAYGFLPNLYGNMAEAPTILEGYLTLSGILDKSSLSPTELQIVLMTNNRLNGCTYCMAAHTTISQMSNVPADVIDALRTGSSITDPKLEALRTFAGIIVESRGWPTAAQVDAFIAAGYSQQTVLEVILATALKTLSNYTNHVAGTELDEAFVPNTWSPELAKAS